MDKKSIVTLANPKREYEGRHGKIHVSEICFENGDKGEYGSKSPGQTKFVIGQEAEYTITPREGFPSTIKPVYQQRGGGGAGIWNKNERRPTNNRSFALAYAKDIAVAMIRSGQPLESFGGTTGIIAIATKFNIFLENKNGTGNEI